ncbi:MAG: hypothetical protein ACJA10_000967 [Oleispira sp.]
MSLLSVKSNLYGYALDRLHGAKIEIVSPNFMNTRTVQDIQIIPKKQSRSAVLKSDGNVEKLIFEKAEKASAITHITTELHTLSLAFENKEEPLADADIAPAKADYSSSSQLPS